MQGQAKSPKKKWGWLWLLVGVLAIVVLIAPLIRGFSLQWRSGKVIRAYVDEFEASEINPAKGNFYCLLPSFYEMPESEELDQAIVWLNQARSLAPSNVYSNFLLGQAYCLKQEYQKSVDAFDDFLTRRPDNQLAKAEAGYAYLALSRSTTDTQNTQDYRSKSLQSLEEAGFSANSFSKLGDASFNQERYQEALVWYQISDSIIGLQDSGLFRYALLQLLLQGSTIYEDQIREGMILEIPDNQTIKPEKLFRIKSGSEIKTRNMANQKVGMLFGKTDDSGILLRVSEAGDYCFAVQTLDAPPAPTIIGVDIDFSPVKQIKMAQGDNRIVETEFEVFLDRGIHLIALKLVNDANVNGIDRNAAVGQIFTKSCSSN